VSPSRRTTTEATAQNDPAADRTVDESARAQVAQTGGSETRPRGRAKSTTRAGSAARSTPSKATTSKAAPDKAAPSKTTPRKATPGKPTSAKAGPTKAAPVKAAPAKAKAAPETASNVPGAEDSDGAEPDLLQTRRARRILRLLAARYPDARLELDFASPLQLLVAATLAAQTLDERVNAVTPILFGRFPSAVELADADADEMEQILVPVGYYRQKTRNVIKLAATLVERHGGDVPQTLDELVALPWVGRKTANMVLGNAFATPAISVDTHVGRVAHRLGWGPEKDIEATEAAIGRLFEKKDWVAVNLLLILHGRRTCHSRKPACGACPLAAECPSSTIGETDPEKARALLK
jgi:endonuclease-3